MTNVKFTRKPFEGTFNTFVDDLFTELPAFFKNEFNNVDRKGYVPVNVKQTERSYQLEVVAPGFEKTDFVINLDQNLLTVSAERKIVAKEDCFGSASQEVKENSFGKDTQEKQIRREYSFRPFKRSFTIDDKIDATKIEASYINGVLTLNLPKTEPVTASATKIVIK